MRANIPTPVVVGVLVVIVLILGFVFWKQSGPSSAGNEDLIRAAFSGKGTPPKFPPTAGGPGAGAPGRAPTPPSAPR